MNVIPFPIERTRPTRDSVGRELQQLLEQLDKIQCELDILIELAKLELEELKRLIPAAN